MKAVRPSLKSSLDIALAMPSIDIFQPTSSGACVASSTTLRVSRTATGALAQTCSARADGGVERLARLDQPVDQAVVVGQLGA